ncbi:MAG: phage terminase large subunit family protein, partial [candidate division WOR-3 bacterium]|nr:phage terminase large subunit family protein [candidate division WOR-3 bacterium]
MASRLLSPRKLTDAALRGIKKASTKDLSLLDWIYEIGITLRGEPFSFAGHEYLREPYQEHHDHQVFMKGAQVGISTYHLLKALWLCDTHHAKVIYFFPTDRDVSDFSNDRAKPLIEANDYLRQRVSGIDNVGLKQIGASSIYFRGMVSKIKVKSVDADYIILDELDECPPENIKFAFDRLLHSKLRWKSQLSQPSVPNFGIHKEFEKSDQRVWSMQCAKCNHWNFFNPNLPNEALDFAEKFLRPDWHCVKCGRKLEIKNQQWIPLYPQRKEIRGYHLTQLYSQIIPGQEILSEI